MQPSQSIGAPIPNNTPHAVSVTLPTWEASIGYEEGKDWVVQKMNSGYPRFFIHSKIQELSKLLEETYAREGERCFVYPTYEVAKRSRQFIRQKGAAADPAGCKPAVRILQLSSPDPKDDEEASVRLRSDIAVVFFPGQYYSLAKQYWQHAGEGISSRQAEYFLSEMKDKLTGDAARAKTRDGRSRRSRSSHSHSPSVRRGSGGRSSRSSRSSHGASIGATGATGATAGAPVGASAAAAAARGSMVGNECETFVEERFGRALDLRHAPEAKRILRERLASEIDEKYTTPEDVYIYPSGMAAIFNAHHLLLKTLTDKKDEKSVCFGFPYVDTLNILRKWGAGVHFYGFGDDESLDDLEKRLEGGERILSLFAECPSNPLLTTPDLKRIRKLADKYNFAVVIDDTVGNPANIEVIPYVDIVVESLTKVFSGDSNVMAGSLVLNRQSPFYDTFKSYLNTHFEDEFWAQDAIYLERNSRDFVRRTLVMDENAVAVLELFEKSPLIDQIYYPKVSKSRKHYDAIKKPKGGYGALMSIVFRDSADAVCFFNSVNLSKGPSLGTNFTLVCPYAILAHYQELDEVAKWGVDRNLVRLSIGMEPTQELLSTLQEALDMAQEQHDI